MPGASLLHKKILHMPSTGGMLVSNKCKNIPVPDASCWNEENFTYAQPQENRGIENENNNKEVV